MNILTRLNLQHIATRMVPGALATSFVLLGSALCLAPRAAKAAGGPDDAPGTVTSVESRAIEFLPRAAGGGIVAIGGGKLPDRIYKKILQLSGRTTPSVLILPLATSDPTGSATRTEVRFRENGATRVDWVNFAREDASKTEILEKIRSANIVYFPGGDQKKILQTIRDTPAERAVRDVLAKGGVVGGTSAGCEVLGDLSLTGRARLDLAVANTTETEPGLALVTGVVFDQHFLRRGRFLRLLSATIDAERKMGIGVDESTAAVFPHGTRRMEVVGERQVTVFRRGDDTKTAPANRGDFTRAAALRLHILAEGDAYDLDKDVVTLAPNTVGAPAETRPEDDDTTSAPTGGTGFGAGRDEGKASSKPAAPARK